MSDEPREADFDPCPKGDTECLTGDDGSCHDACETPTADEPRETPTNFVDIVFDGPPGHLSGRFVEVENESGASIRLGEWVHRVDGYWALRIPREAKRLSVEGA
jgi:hypothetical protein